MRVAVYFGHDYPDSVGVSHELRAAGSHRLEFYPTLRSLSAGIIASWQDPFRALIVALNGPDDQAGIFPLRELFADLPLILLLAEDDRASLKLAHRLRPRLLSCRPHDFTAIASALEHLKNRA